MRSRVAHWPRRRCGRYPNPVRIALIPVKELSQAKARLAPVLDDVARRELALAMYRDVLAAALACDALDAVAVVTRDAEVLSLAEAAGAEGLAEPGGLNEALASASEQVARRGVERLLVVASDLPFVTSDDIAAVLRAVADVAVAPAKDGGTNALALSPGAIPFRFGPGSARRHLEEARARRLRGRQLELRPLAFDVDTPEDLGQLRTAVEDGAPVGAYTAALFETIWSTA